jgi:hypothetical protein
VHRRHRRDCRLEQLLELVRPTSDFTTPSYPLPDRGGVSTPKFGSGHKRWAHYPYLLDQNALSHRTHFAYPRFPLLCPNVGNLCLGSIDAGIRPDLADRRLGIRAARVGPLMRDEEVGPIKTSEAMTNDLLACPDSADILPISCDQLLRDHQDGTASRHLSVEDCSRETEVMPEL